MKSLKFTNCLIPLIISGDKTATWRLFDDKDLKVGDEISLINKMTGEQFASAVIISVKEKALGDINDSDFDGHEKFESKEKMFEEYHSYYGNRITPESVVKMIDFKLLE